MMKNTTLYFVIALTLLTSCSENNVSKEDAATGNPDSLAGKNTYVNPVDGKTYVTAGEYRNYTPEGGSKPANGPVQLVNVVLLTDQDKIPAIISIDKMAGFIKGIDTVVISELSGVKEKGQIVLQFTLHADKKPTVGLSYDGDFKYKTLNDLSQKVDQYSLDIRTQKDTCIFQSVYGINKNQN